MATVEVLGQVVGKPNASTLAMTVCALGRGLDFATTWVAISRGQAVEAKPVVADVLYFLGHQSGLIAYEALITTPAIFLGCHFAKRFARAQHADNTRWQVFLSVGVISLIVALHNAQFLF
jgi:hypothetical protein